MYSVLLKPDAPLEEVIEKTIAASKAKEKIKRLQCSLAGVSGDKAVRIGQEIRNLEVLEREAGKITDELIRRAMQSPSNAARMGRLLSGAGEQELLGRLADTIRNEAEEFRSEVVREIDADPLLVKIALRWLDCEPAFKSWVESLLENDRRDVVFELALQLAKLKERYDVTINTKYLRRFHLCYRKLSNSGEKEKTESLLDVWVSSHLPNYVKSMLTEEHADGIFSASLQDWMRTRRPEVRTTLEALADFLFLSGKSDCLRRLSGRFVEIFEKDREASGMHNLFVYYAGTLRLLGDETTPKELYGRWENSSVKWLSEELTSRYKTNRGSLGF